MNPYESLPTIPEAAWPELHRHALARGCGDVLDLSDERLAAPDELVALAVPQLVRVGRLALICDSELELPCECARALTRAAGTVVRLLDRALLAHARDVGYARDAWLAGAFECAHVRARVIATITADDLPLGLLVDGGADATADVVMALQRDRLGVPEGLGSALASLLVLYAAGEAMGG